MKMPNIRSTVAALVCSVAFTAHATADEPKRIEVPAGNLVVALETLSRQAAVDLVFQPDQLRSFRTEGVSGTYSPEDAIRILLKGTSLQLRTDASSGAMVIAPPATATSSNASLSVANLMLADGALAQGATDPSQGMQAAQSSPSEGEGQGEDQKAVGKSAEGVAASQKGIPEILVRGKKGQFSLNADIERSRDDIQPYTIINREAITRSGATDVGALLRMSLPASSTPLSNTTGASIQGNTSSINLRGLGTSQTLVLIDGRPASSFNIAGDMQQPDLNGIPLSAIERIEVLPMSASGIYGGRATGGVVNVVLRREYSGLESTLSYGNTFQSSAATSRLDLAGGLALNGGRTNIVLSGSYADTNPLLVRDRDFLGRARETLVENNRSVYFGPSAQPPLGATTNIRSNAPLVGGVRPNLTLKGSNLSLGSAVTFVPYGYAGASSDNGAALVNNAGGFNFDPANTAQNGGGAYQTLYRGSIVRSGRGTVRQEFTDALSGFLELSKSINYSASTLNGMQASYNIPASSPVNPFNQAITVVTPGVGADSPQRSRLEDTKAIVGAIYQVPNTQWQFGFDYTWERTELSAIAASSGITASGRTAVTSGAVNVLRDTNIYPVDFRQFQVLGTEVTPVKTTMRDVSLRTGGAILDLPGGSVGLSIQGESRNDDLDEYQLRTINFVSAYPARSQRVNSLYTELRLPVVSPLNGRGWISLLELQVAGRLDDYKLESTNVLSIQDDVLLNSVEIGKNRFRKFSPTAGIRIAPTPDMMLRFSYSAGFLPPNLTQIVPDADSILPDGFPFVLDPSRGNAPITTPLTILNGGDPNLRPETSESKSVGVVFTPRVVPGLRFSFDWVRINKKDNISSAGLENLLALEAVVPGLVTRAPPQNDGFAVGPITSLNLRQMNLNRARIEAYDWALDYKLHTDVWGEFSFEVGATQSVHNQIQITPVSPFTELAATGALPRWSARGSLTWKWKGNALGWSSQYLGDYWYQTSRQIHPNYGGLMAPSAIYHDFFASRHFEHAEGRALSGLLSGMELTLGIRNVFNTRPRVSVDSTLSSFGFDQRTDPRLASYQVSVRKAF